MIPPVRGWISPEWTGPGLVQSSPRGFWTGIEPVQISAGLVRAWTGPVHSGGISPMSQGVSHTLCRLIESYNRRHIRSLIHNCSLATYHQAADCDWYIILILWLIDSQVINADAFVVDDCDRFLSTPTEPSITNPFSFWQSQREIYPKLSSMALDILSIPPMFAGVERLFSKSKIMLTDRRNRLQIDSLQWNVWSHGMGFKSDSHRLLLLECSWRLLRIASNCMLTSLVMGIRMWKWCNLLEDYTYHVTSWKLLRSIHYE